MGKGERVGKGERSNLLSSLNRSYAAGIGGK